MFLKDFKRIKKLGRYLTKDKKTIYLILIVLLPVSFAGAIQPLLLVNNNDFEKWEHRCLVKQNVFWTIY